MMCAHTSVTFLRGKDPMKNQSSTTEADCTSSNATSKKSLNQFLIATTIILIIAGAVGASLGSSATASTFDYRSLGFHSSDEMLNYLTIRSAQITEIPTSAAMMRKVEDVTINIGPVQIGSTNPNDAATTTPTTTPTVAPPVAISPAPQTPTLPGAVPPAPSGVVPTLPPVAAAPTVPPVAAAPTAPPVPTVHPPLTIPPPPVSMPPPIAGASPAPSSTPAPGVKPPITIQVPGIGPGGAIGGIDPSQILPWISLGEKIWALIAANKPVVSVQTKRAFVLPVAEQDWTQMENWKGPAVHTYRLQYKNGFGSTVITHVYTIAYNFGGTYNERGQFLANVTVIPSKVDVAWGYTLNTSVELGEAVNTASKASPIPGIEVQIITKVDTVLKHAETRDGFFVKGSGECQPLTTPSATLEASPLSY